MGAAAMPIATIAGPAIGGFLSGRSAQPTLTQLPRPGQLYPEANSSYLNNLNNAQGPAFNTLARFSSNGMPVNYMDSFNAIKAQQQRGIDEGRANLMEKYGSQGTRFSSGMATAATDFEAQTQANFGSILAQFAQQSQEAAANRQLQASGISAQLASEPGLATYPTAALTSGAPSPLGQAVSGASGGLLNYLLYSKIFGGANQGSGGGNPTAAGGGYYGLTPAWNPQNILTD